MMTRYRHVPRTLSKRVISKAVTRDMVKRKRIEDKAMTQGRPGEGGRNGVWVDRSEEGAAHDLQWWH